MAQPGGRGQRGAGLADRRAGLPRPPGRALLAAQPLHLRTGRGGRFAARLGLQLGSDPVRAVPAAGLHEPGAAAAGRVVQTGPGRRGRHRGQHRAGGRLPDEQAHPAHPRRGDLLPLRAGDGAVLHHRHRRPARKSAAAAAPDRAGGAAGGRFVCLLPALLARQLRRARKSARYAGAEGPPALLAHGRRRMGHLRHHRAVVFGRGRGAVRVAAPTTMNSVLWTIMIVSKRGGCQLR